MTHFISKPQIGDIVKLSGKMAGYRCTRASASFVFSESAHQKLGIIAVGAALAGQPAGFAPYTSEIEESADFLEFDLAGMPVKGWVWRSPFQEGDSVNVAAEWNGEYFAAYGIARPDDKMIALYPHCSRARGKHVKNALKWWVRWNFVWFVPLFAFLFNLGGFDLILDPAFFWLSSAMAAFWTLMFVCLTLKFMPFVHLSEKIFCVLGLTDPKNIDLVASSKRQRTDIDSPEFGTFYFRY